MNPLQQTLMPRQPLLDQLRQPGGLALGFLGVALSLVTVFVLPEWKVAVQWLVAVAIIFLCYLAVSLGAIRELKRNGGLLEAERDVLLNRSQPPEPKVICSMANPSDESELILLLESNRLFGQSMIVSIYYENENGFELLVAGGRVVNIQTNGLIQIVINAWEANTDGVRRDVVAQQLDKLARLLVRPAPTTSIPSQLTEKYLLQLINTTDNQGMIEDD